MRTFFRFIVIGERFICEGNAYVKKSSRTALVAKGHPAYDPSKPRWFYFGQMEGVLR